MGPLLNQQTSFHSNLLFRMGRLIEMELLKSLAAASQTAIQEELRIVWWVVDCLLWLVCLRGYGPWPAMALRERKTNKKSNQQSKEREWTNQLLLERPFSKEWMKWMSWWKKRKGVVFVNGAPRPAGRGKSNNFLFHLSAQFSCRQNERLKLIGGCSLFSLRLHWATHQPLSFNQRSWLNEREGWVAFSSFLLWVMSSAPAAAGPFHSKSIDWFSISVPLPHWSFMKREEISLIY